VCARFGKGSTGWTTIWQVPQRSKQVLRRQRILSSLIAVPVTITLTVALAATLTIALAAGPAAASTETEEPERDAVTRAFDRVWGFATLYQSADNPVLQRLALVGRFQVDFPVYDSNHGNYDDPQVRRFRAGAKSRWLQDFTLHAEVDIDLDCDRGEDCDDTEYEGLTDAYVGWDRYEELELKLGKISAPFTLDGATSSKRLITVERNNVSQNLWFTVEYHAGGIAQGRVEEWSYRAGAFSSSTKKEFGTFDGGYFLLFSLTRDLALWLDVPEFSVTLDYVYNEEDRDNLGTRDLGHVFSLHTRFDSGTWGIRGDLSGGLGYEGQEDLVGLVLVPFYSITPKFQVVVRYTHLSSSGRDGIRFSRYDDRLDSARGGQYDEGFMGLNWFVYGHDFKIQTGVKYAVMTERPGPVGNYRGWGWTLGLRMAW
jgi:phosphate-selective porin OprO/OprP